MPWRGLRARAAVHVAGLAAPGGVLPSPSDVIIRHHHMTRIAASFRLPRHMCCMHAREHRRSHVRPPTRACVCDVWPVPPLPGSSTHKERAAQSTLHAQLCQLVMSESRWRGFESKTLLPACVRGGHPHAKSCPLSSPLVYMDMFRQ